VSPRLPPEIVDVLEGGSFCYVAAGADIGPHLTPLVYALSGTRLWLTPSRRSVKARAWRRDPRVGGLVEAGGLSVSFAGTVRTYDLLDPGTWAPSLVGAPVLAVAAARFTRKNARFFAGYAVDAHRVPLSWTPPGRMFVEVELFRAAVLDEAGGVELWGRWERGLGSHGAFRASRKGRDPLAGLPDEVLERVDARGRGALAVEGGGGIAVLPVGWSSEASGLYGALPEGFLELAGAGPTARVALAIDHASWWRASGMTGAMVQGEGRFFVLERLRSGARSAAARVEGAGLRPDGAALVGIVPRRVVWWRGWSSGTVAAGWP